MSQIVAFAKSENYVTITMDDGKANAVSPLMIKGLNAALDLAENEKKQVILTGRPGKFSAGFDLTVIQQGQVAKDAMVKAGALLAVRLLSFSTPVIIACNGHALAMGALLRWMMVLCTSSIRIISNDVLICSK